MLVAGGRVCAKLFENIYFFEFDLDNCCGLKSLLVSSFIFIVFTENYICGRISLVVYTFSCVFVRWQ